MPAVEWAETPAVSRVGPLQHDKPGRTADEFAAVFDLARRSISARDDRRAGEGGRPRPADAAGAETPPEPPARQTPEVLADEARPQTPEAPDPDAGHGQAEPQAPAVTGEMQNQPVGQDDASPPMVAADARAVSQWAETGAGQETSTLPERGPRPVEPPRRAVPATPAEPAVAARPAVRVDSGGPVQPALPAEPATPATPAVPAEPLAPMIADSLSILTATPPSASGSLPVGEDPTVALTATNPSGQPGSPVAVDTAAETNQLEPVVSLRWVADLPPTVWQGLREVSAHLEQETAHSQKPAATAAAQAPGSTQVVAAENGRSRPAGTPGTAPVSTVGTDGASPPRINRELNRGKEQDSESGVSREPSAETGKATNAAARQSDASEPFRSLLEAAGRVRDRIILPDLEPGTGVVGRDPNGRGVSLSEAGAINELAEVVRATAGGRHSSIVLRLEPPELGQMRIDVRMSGQELALRLQADTLAGHDALKGRLHELRNSLEQHGFKLNQIEVELRLPQTSPPESHQDRTAQQQTHHDGHASHGPGWQGPSGGGGASAEPDLPNEGSAFSQESASPGEERDWVEGPAETGLDMVV